MKNILSNWKTFQSKEIHFILKNNILDKIKHFSMGKHVNWKEKTFYI